MSVVLTIGFMRRLVVFCCFIICKALRCRDCLWMNGKDPNDCRLPVTTNTVQCPSTSKYCEEWAKFTDDDDPANIADVMRYVVNRRCSGTRRSELPTFPGWDIASEYDRLWKIAADNQRTSICRIMNEHPLAPIDGTHMNRVCICREDTCNSHTWNDMVTLPFVPYNFNASSKPVYPALGYNDLPVNIGQPGYVPELYQGPATYAGDFYGWRRGNHTNSAPLNTVEPVDAFAKLLPYLGFSAIFLVLHQEFQLTLD
ncbi:uncharacterized protein LOC129600799 isoform X2 [Paramacrobiotus metropolitanus]|uniref:uncharacterized protein LOC129600799 isoform X2 n=1 Tax=Paramacrobiotus metropolitanus TaxID=2943436 RepID=UPI002446572E|nr:uncharacterized protein LOC129600799 isoform X2 [Paramacrobiotus metropolitanus]